MLDNLWVTLRKRPFASLFLITIQFPSHVTCLFLRSSTAFLQLDTYNKQHMDNTKCYIRNYVIMDLKLSHSGSNSFKILKNVDRQMTSK